MDDRKLVEQDFVQSYQAVIQRASKSLIKPVHDVCCAAVNVSKQIQAIQPSQDQIWEVERKGRLLENQILFLRTMERRMELEQVQSGNTPQKMESLEQRMQQLVEVTETENAENENALFEQRILSLRTLLKNKFDIVVPATVVAPPNQEKTTTAVQNPLSSVAKLDASVSVPSASPNVPRSFPVTSTPLSQAKFRSRIPRLSDVRSAQKSPYLKLHCPDNQIPRMEAVKPANAAGSAAKYSFAQSLANDSYDRIAIKSSAVAAQIPVPAVQSLSSPVYQRSAVLQTPSKFHTPGQRAKPAVSSNSKQWPNRAPVVSQSKSIPERVPVVVPREPSPAKNSLEEVTRMINMLRSKRLV
ncbi:uncharacterized protein LOC129586284 [Paramacrobiotus metropolitanus]|uniref:uncharacterized protein LOC129586284 n=1 Tax=Paramacrobiotus metropolitanus TaxID=2943436 RepID=UPI002445774E|nr:uncharacterized protein LOC129586284 [Paramacrobiotus metropolitanus]